jgi:hypothetical protein
MDSDVEVTGRYIVSMVESAGEVSPVFERKIRDLLGDHGISDPDADQWYSATDFAAAVNEAATAIGDKTVLEAGVQMGKDVPQPPVVEGPKDALQHVDDAQRAAYRNSDDPAPAGGYTYETVDDRTARVGVTEAWPYPREIAEGSLKGIVKSTADGAAVVSVSETVAEPGEAFAFEVSW